MVLVFGQDLAREDTIGIAPLLCLKNCLAWDQEHASRVDALLLVDTVNSVQTLKAQDAAAVAKHRPPPTATTAGGHSACPFKLDFAAPPCY
jgi:hypothetical protein